MKVGVTAIKEENNMQPSHFRYNSKQQLVSSIQHYLYPSLPSGSVILINNYLCTEVSMVTRTSSISLTHKDSKIANLVQ